MRVLALIDGEHQPAVARDALDRLAREHELAGVLFVGGQEKVGEQVLADSARHYGRNVANGAAAPEDALRELAVAHDAEAVLDLSGEPVLDGAARLRLACVALHLGLEYRAAGFRLGPPSREPLDFDGPVLEVIGTGKRTGKTAIAGHYAALLRERAREPVVVSMGRGGPREPQLVRAEDRPDLGFLREIVRAGGHAASDYLEDAVLAGVSCVGCRRCGEGPAGEVFDSNVLEGAALALTIAPDVVLVEGSGAAIPPIHAHRTVCVTSAARPQEALSYLGPYRLLRSDLVVIVVAGDRPAEGLAGLKRSLGEWCEHGLLLACRLEPEPASRVRPGARAALFTTAPAGRERELREALARHGVEVRVFSPNLARRAALRLDLERAAAELCDVYLTELKAAAIDIVAEDAQRRGADVVFVRNRPVPLLGEPDLDDALLDLLEQAREAAASPAAALRR